MKKGRLAGTVAALAFALALIVFLPLPFSVKCTFEVQPRGGRQIYPIVAGQIKDVHFRPGDVVQPGDVLLELENLDLELELKELEAREEESAQSIRNLKVLRHYDPLQGDQIEMAKEVHKSVQQQREQRKKEFERLAIKVPEGVSGTIIPPPSRVDRMAAATGRLPSWNGTPFDPKNRGALLTPTDLVCQIGNPEDMEAVLIIDQSYIDLVQKGHPVRLLLEAHTRKAIESQIEEIASTELKVTSASMSATKGGRLETKPDEAGQLRPLNPSYQARAPLTNAVGALQAGMQGQARIYTGWQPLARRIYRKFIKTFNFDF